MSEEDLITSRQAIEISSLTADHLRELMREGKIAGRKFGETWQIDKSSLLAYMRQMQKRGAKRGPKKG